ncbi:hemin uptake protein HemP [Brachymonas denitrificans]|uniref:hemin uptake protein HemP n=1 Tax=Brachymonas denitrificans TaxID=28220 RepID=UPI002AFE1A67|nr:hemin uptake protein HemP [Brachymonas denitrificans]
MSSTAPSPDAQEHTAAADKAMSPASALPSVPTPKSASAETASVSPAHWPVQAQSHASPLPETAAESPPAFSSSELMQGHRTIAIRHNGVTYRLQATRQGKLILTK